LYCSCVTPGHSIDMTVAICSSFLSRSIQVQAVARACQLAKIVHELAFGTEEPALRLMCFATVTSVISDEPGNRARSP
jgi:hypothetical protein